MTIPFSPQRVLGYLAAALLAVWALDCSGRDEGDKTARTEMHERNATVAMRDLRAERKRTDTVVVRERAQGARVDAAVDSVRPALAEARATLADSTATIERLRASLGSLTVRTEELVAQVVIYRATVEELTLALAMERAAAQATLDAKDKVIASLKAERCRVLWMPCPTRTQSAIGGAIVGALVIGAVSR